MTIPKHIGDVSVPGNPKLHERLRMIADACPDLAIKASLMILVMELEADDHKKDVRKARNRRWYEKHRASNSRLNGVLKDAPQKRLTRRSDSVLTASNKTPTITIVKEVCKNSALRKGKKESKNTPLPPKIENPDFDQFWSAYPHKVAKGAAVEAFNSINDGTPLQTILEGLARYIDTKPDWQQFANPATWLNGRRWEDHPAPVIPEFVLEAKRHGLEVEARGKNWKVSGRILNSDGQEVGW